ncbi:TPA: alpha/beta hydrolase, partial [Salmonella enterica subsp. enterica serovar 6,7:y:-]
VNRYYKQQSAQAQKARVAAMEERNRLIARLLEKSDRDSMLKILAASEIPEGSDGAEDEG